MTWLLGICFSLALVLPGTAATVSGHLELRDSHDARVRSKSDFSGVVVSLTPASGDARPAAPVHARMIQQNKSFIPHVLAIPAGSTVDFPNFDPIFHSAFSNYSGQVFDVGLYPPGTSQRVRFTRVGVVRIFCNIHSSMSAVIVVLGSPYFTVSNRDGTFTIPNVEPGEYRLDVFHERATEGTLKALSQRIVAGTQPVSVPGIAISESGYLPIPHKNKFGRDYGPEPDDTSVYPGVRK